MDLISQKSHEVDSHVVALDRSRIIEKLRAATAPWGRLGKGGPYRKLSIFDLGKQYFEYCF